MSEQSAERTLSNPQNHLPECLAPLHDDYCMGYEDCFHTCICPELRACEERVREDEKRLAKYGQPVADYENDPFYRKGHAAGVRAARFAVIEREADFMRITNADRDSWACRIYGDALAAIDGVKGS